MDYTAKQNQNSGENKSIFSSPGAYASAAAATLPASLARTVSGIPVKTLEGTLVKKLESKYRGAAPIATGAAIKTGLRRSASSALGAGLAGAALMPSYIAGIKKLKSEDPAERRKGYALLAAQGIAFSTIKGIAESAGEASKSAPKGEVIRKFKGKLGAAALVGIPALLLTSKSVADAQRKLDSSTDKKEVARSLVNPAIVGGLVGAATGAIETAIEDSKKVPADQRKAALKNMLSVSGGKRMLPKAIGYGAAGVIGGGLSALIANKAIKDSDKKGIR